MFASYSVFLFNKLDDDDDDDGTQISVDVLLDQVTGYGHVGTVLKLSGLRLRLSLNITCSLIFCLLVICNT